MQKVSILRFILKMDTMNSIDSQILKNYLDSCKEKDLFKELNISEDFDECKIKIRLLSIEQFLININSDIYKHLFSAVFSLKDHIDTIKININDNVETLESFNTLEEVSIFNYQFDRSDKEGSLEIIISKVSNEYTTIYFLDNFIEFLNNTSNISFIFELFEKHNNKFKIFSEQNFLVKTNSFYFASAQNFDPLVVFENKNADKLKKINENCHFGNAASIKFLPEDFYHYFNNSFPNQNFKNLFERLSLALILRVFSDVSEFDSNKLTYKMFGYKTIKHEYNFMSLNTKSLNDYYQSYNDLFFDNSNFIDKIGLARNVISLHTINQDFTNIKGDIYSSIKSNYNIYLKENIKKYIDLKNKITDKLFTISSSFDNLVDDFSKSFKSSFYTLATIFLSLILLRLIKGSTSTIPIFTFEVYVFLISVLFAMYLYKKYILFELSHKKDRIFEQYEQLKNQYISLLDKSDLNELLMYENFKEKNNKYISTQTEQYSKYWNKTLLVYFISFTFLTICA